MFSVQLFGKDKGGGYKVWNIRAHGHGQNSEAAIIVIEHGKEGGKLSLKTDPILKGKQGRSCIEQAISEAEGRIKKQIDKGYRESKDELDNLPLLAMLAGDATKIGHRIKYRTGVDLSDKLDGVRALAKCVPCDINWTGKKVTLESRTGQPYVLPHITEELARFMQIGEVLDGEIYLHGEVLQDITSAVKRTDSKSKKDKAEAAFMKYAERSDCEQHKCEELEAKLNDAVKIHRIRERLQFIVFDKPSDEVWTIRLADLQDYARVNFFAHGYVRLIRYTRVWSEEEMKLQHKDCVARGYEGVMIRNAEGLYESGKRSADLQKYKEFVDAEFMILDILPAKDDGSVYLLRNDLTPGKFTCTMGDMTERAKALAEKEQRIGLFLNVKFQSRYKDTLLPQFPTGQYIREGAMINGQFVPYE